MPAKKASLPAFTKVIPVLLVEDHTILREGLKALLEAEGDIWVAGQAENGRKAVEMAALLRPAVILMDIAMPLMNGLEAARQILAADPHAKIILLSAHGDDAYVEKAASIGAVGYLAKQISLEALAKVIREVDRDPLSLSPAVARHLHHPEHRHPHQNQIKRKITRLTSRETEVLQLVAEGHANKQVAAELAISIKTVEKHRENLMVKLGIHDTAGLTRYAIASGVIENSVQFSIV
jgi:DNA-binding NarL/FixJ family response regulator